LAALAGARPDNLDWRYELGTSASRIFHKRSERDGHSRRPGPLGTRAELISRIRELLPETDFSDPSWGILDEPGFSIEFNMGEENF
jgi:hypothetical protein